MIRGTTAGFKFKLPYTKQDLLWVTIKFWQPGNKGTSLAPLPITKKKEQCLETQDAYEICVSLTPEETLRFSDQSKAVVQLRAQTYDGVTFASKETLVSVYPIHDDIITDDPTFPEADNTGVIILDGQSIAE
jgi:hypothetical protein